MSKKVSIIVPAYNVAEYLEDCISSIRNQTYSNIEIIIVDDGSTDSTGVIGDLLSTKDNRVRVVHKSNGGVSSARNIGLEVASGDYIMFVDGDDWIDFTTINLLLEKVECYNADICYATQYYRNENNLEIATILDDKKEYSSIEILREHLHYKFIASPCFSLIRSQIAKKVRFNTEIHTLEDWEYNFQIISYAKTIGLINTAFYHYRTVNGSASKSPLNMRKISCFKIKQSVEKRIKELEPFRTFNTQIVQSFLIYHMLVAYAGSGAVDNTQRILRNICIRSLYPTIFSKDIAIRHKLYTLLGAIHPKLFKCLYNFTNS